MDAVSLLLNALTSDAAQCVAYSVSDTVTSAYGKLKQLMSRRRGRRPGRGCSPRCSEWPRLRRPAASMRGLEPAPHRPAQEYDRGLHPDAGPGLCGGGTLPVRRAAWAPGRGVRPGPRPGDRRARHGSGT
jgi:hypothetical protein